MDIFRFTLPLRGGIKILDFVAEYSWKTESSISFHLGRYDDTSAHKNFVFTVFGWLEVHHPCYDHTRVRIRAKLSAELMQAETQLAIINVIFDELKIPRDETYEADFFVTQDYAGIYQPVDRDG